MVRLFSIFYKKKSRGTYYNVSIRISLFGFLFLCSANLRLVKRDNFCCRRNRSKLSTGLSVENERADAGRDSQIRLARPNSQAQTGTGRNILSLVQLTTSRIDNLTPLGRRRGNP